MNTTVFTLVESEIESMLPQLVGLLQDAVDSGASLGFLPPLATAEAQHYWRSVAEDVRAGHRVVLAAWHPAQKMLLGTVQLALATKPNAAHRAEIAKLIVHSKARRQGIGQQLLLALEVQALQLGRTTLVLDTRLGDVAEQLYQRMQYQPVGHIPEYFQNTDGQLHATAIYCKLLKNE